MARDVITLGDIVSDRISIACTRCERRGDYATASLIERWGAEIGLPDLGFQLSAEHPRRATAGAYDRCDVVFSLRPRAR